MTELLLDDIISLLPKRREDSHKGTFGTLVSFVGSTLYRGAALLSSMGALRTGVGILRLCCVEKVASAVANSLPEVTFHPSDGNYLSLSEKEIGDIFTQYKPSACLCGCGLTAREECAETVKHIIKKCNVPLVLDADALNVISADASILQSARCPVTVTPHLGEFARLTGIGIDEIKSAPEKYALAFAEKYNCTVVLKSNYTLIATPDGKCFVSNYGNSGLSRGGSGDILAGMIASFNAQGLSAENAARCGVVLHGKSADLCAERLSKSGMLPHDILCDLCEIYKKYGL